ncbi:MAG: hypothetical protein ACE5ID_01345, partial [Acidobacteriota bacterium]
MLLRTETVRPEIMPEFGTFEATETQIAPTAYLVPAELTAVLDRLRAHGVRMLPLAQAHRLEVQVFHVERSRTADKPFQQHRERTVTGHYLYREEEVPAGTFMVAMNQPLGRLIFHLLEPRSDDGLLHWNLMDRFLSAHDRVPILRINGPLPEIPDKASTPVSPPPRGAPGTGGES